MTIVLDSEIEWRKDGYGRDAHALYLGGLCVGWIGHHGETARHAGGWRGWFMVDEDGDETGWFTTAEAARASVEARLFNAIRLVRPDLAPQKRAEP